LSEIANLVISAFYFQNVPENLYAVGLHCMQGSKKLLSRAALQPFFDQRVKKVIVAAPVKDANPVLNIVFGCNETQYDPQRDHIVTAASCTTNCLAPVVKVIHEKLGIVHGCITTVHNITNTQTVVDAPNNKKSDLRRARSGLVNLAPTSTGSATAIALIFPELKGKLNGLAIRVPLINSSITDCVFEVKQKTTVEEVNNFLQDAASTYLDGILGFEQQPLVSTDYINDRRSSIIDALSTQVQLEKLDYQGEFNVQAKLSFGSENEPLQCQPLQSLHYIRNSATIIEVMHQNRACDCAIVLMQVIDGTLVKIYAWYDNEFGYAMRYCDLVRLCASKL